MTLVFATNNAHKLKEVKQILPSVYAVLSLADIGCHEEIEETGETLEANSLLKAQFVSHWLQQHPYSTSIDGVFADDTGLEVVCLNNAPGVHTARFAGEPVSDQRNRAKLLQVMSAVPVNQRTARFRTVVTLIRHGQTIQVEGIVNGSIACEERGTEGFGYDSLFIPEGYNKCFAELSPEEKNSISHRGRAMQRLKETL